ncbi:hypothetical protein [Thermomonas sp.]|jgi:hypothetical protein|nr:hypothetical protein [Thermomonas sp.]MBK6925535.1 hypothetical protein [Thermomonas sp.]MBK9669960.1 hypothetical protein [Thermomonas sp.]MBL0228214.1 hypothetical protein [Thermomonas sp.]MBP7788375.1 hypothetical protein [Thermomonas sp.]HQY83142.1 hypothetical protein [Thermomonas sp.]
MRLSPILLSLALLCASSQVLAAESREIEPDGNGNCPDAAPASNDGVDDPDGDAAATPVRRAQKAKAAPAARGGGSSSQRSSAPRWHSFLPGMIR